MSFLAALSSVRVRSRRVRSSVMSPEPTRSAAFLRLTNESCSSGHTFFERPRHPT